MAQQPNIEVTPADLPRATLEPGPPRRPGLRPGTITSPEEKPSGGQFGTPGPDTGWALRILSGAEIPERSKGLEKVLVALMSARSAHFGRAPVPEDLEVALTLVGLGRHTSEELDERRRRWVGAAAHEKSPGRLAVAEAGEDLELDVDHLVVRLRN